MNQNTPYDLDLFWETSNFGLAFFEQEFAQFAGGRKGLKGFSLRDNDDTGSAYVTKTKKSPYYLFTDFGANNITPDQKGINAIEYVIRTQNVDFLAACAILFRQFNLPVRELDKIKPKVEFSSNVTKKEGYWKANYFNKFQDVENLKRIFPYYTDELLAEYHFQQLQGFEVVGKNKEGNLYNLTTTATPEFPIYGYKQDEFVKLYQPFAPKGDQYILKHSFIGKKPERFIYGWDRLFDLVDFELIENLYNDLKKTTSKNVKESLKKEIESLQLDSVFIATGGTDGINIASLGYNVIWFNSETEIINKDEYYKLSKIAKNIYYVPDLDHTGVAQAVTMGMKYLKIKMVWLPEALQDQNKKDIADWIRLNKAVPVEVLKAMFEQLVSQALEFQFWEWNDKRGTYSIAPKRMIHFLKHQGFCVFKRVDTTADMTKEAVEFQFIRIQNKVISNATAPEIKDFVLRWLEQNFINIKVQDMIIKSAFFSDRSGLMSLPTIEDLNTKTGTYNSQIYFFENKAVQITKEAIKTIDYKIAPCNVWKPTIIKRNFAVKPNAFEIYKDDQGDWRIKIIDDSSSYLKVLINTSRIYWQKDIDKQGNDTHRFKINSSNLSDEENKVQELQLINKIFCIGHLGHLYKSISKAYLVLGIDRKIGKSVKENNGCSGKSFLIKTTLNYISNVKIVDGRALAKDDKFLLDGVTKNTNLVYWEDLSPYFDFNSLFNHVDGQITANHKGSKMITIPFDDYAKTAVTMNAVPYDISKSLSRRLVTFECCDYYHEISEEYTETRTIKTDFGKDLFDNKYPAEEWINDDNFFMQCVQFYLGVDSKIEVTQGNLMVRNLIQQIGEQAMKFFTNFFDDKEGLATFGHTDNAQVFWFHKKAVYDNYKEELGGKAKSSQEFKDILDLYCKFKNWELEFKKKKIDGIGNAVEHFSIAFDQSSKPIATEAIPEEKPQHFMDFDDDINPEIIENF
jgi:hypothetical protein